MGHVVGLAQSRVAGLGAPRLVLSSLSGAGLVLRKLLVASLEVAMEQATWG